MLFLTNSANFLHWILPPPLSHESLYGSASFCICVNPVCEKQVCFCLPCVLCGGGRAGVSIECHLQSPTLCSRCVYMYVGVPYGGRPEVSIRCLPELLSTLLFWGRELYLRTNWLANWPMSSWGLPVSASQHWGYRCCGGQTSSFPVFQIVIQISPNYVFK